MSNDNLEATNTLTKKIEKIIELGPRGRYAKLSVLLGKGAYKIVYKGIDRDEGFEVAWNCFQHTTKAEFMDFSSEIEILKKVRHPNIIAFHDCWYTNNEFIFVTELMTSGTLREYIHKLQIPNTRIIKRWSRQILKGLAYLHSYNPTIIHRDIKCDNIFINGAHGEVKIGDMGTAKMKLGKKYTVIGTPEFMAPEMYEEKGYNEKVDIYAFGMCLLEMVTGDYPYSECNNAAQIYRRVSQGIKPECLKKVQDSDILGLINSCLGSENDRPTAQEMLEHTFLAVDPEVILLNVDSKKNLLLQVVFKGTDKLSVKFDFNVDNDTAEEVVKEMIEEQVLPQRYQHLITFEINRILRGLNRPTLGESSSTKENRHTWHKSASIEEALHNAKKELAMAAERANEAEKKAVISEQRARAAEEKNKPGGSTPSSIPIPEPKNKNSDSDNQASFSSLSSGKNLLMSAFKLLSGNKSDDDGYNSPPDPQTPQPTSSQASRRSTHGEWDNDNDDGETLINKGIKKSIEENIPPDSFPIYTRSSSFLEYSDDSPIEEIVFDTASLTNRGADKASEWLIKLKTQDVVTVGDLRDLHEEDWSNLGLTVFASRALRNCLRGRNVRSPKQSIKIPNITPTSTVHGIDNLDLPDSLPISTLSTSQ
ncbi:kinase-like protein [Neoconidiobolus thromboides FSU 785]|nr:kinase-like protein [Neoconidiobolus thromboides FSU 785]